MAKRNLFNRTSNKKGPVVEMDGRPGPKMSDTALVFHSQAQVSVKHEQTVIRMFTVTKTVTKTKSTIPVF